MKKLLFALVAILCLTACHKDILSSIDDLKMQYQNLDSRVTRLENLCKEMNTNITALQTIVDVLQSNDYITGITEIKKSGDIIGYTITFGKHSPITIYNGEDGKDGKDGADGSSFAPTIGIQKDTDGVYYWTLNGSWLLDDQGNKLRVTGEKGEKGDAGAAGQDGQNGTNGTNGQDGANGTNGTDGITPQLKIEDGFWFVSYNGGTSWTMVGRATGEQGEKGDKGDTGATGATGPAGQDGQNGQDGAKGDTGDSMFSSVTYDANYVYFTLADGTLITITRGTISQSGDGYVNSGIIQGHYYVDLDLPSGTKWATCNVGSNRIEGAGYFYAWGEINRKTTYTQSNYGVNYSSLPTDISGTQYDPAKANWGSQWNLPTSEQYQELVSFCSWTLTTHNDVAGWKVCGSNGNAIFLPLTGISENINYGSFYVSNFLLYMSSTKIGSNILCLSNIPSSSGAYYSIQGPYEKDSPAYVSQFHLIYRNSTDQLLYFLSWWGYPVRAVLSE